MLFAVTVTVVYGFWYQTFGPDPKRDLLMCKDHGPIEFGPVPNLDM